MQAGVGFRVGSREIVRGELQRCTRGLNGDARQKMRENAKLAIFAVGEKSGRSTAAGKHPQRCVGVRFNDIKRAEKCLWNYADNGGGHPVQIHALAHDGGIPVEAAHPVGITENDNRIGPRRLALSRKKESTQGRLNAERRKVISLGEGDQNALAAFACAQAREVDEECRHVGSDFAVRLKILEVGVRELVRVVGLRVLVGDHHQVRRILDRQRAKEERIDDAENGCVCADSDGERKYRRGREPGRLAQLPQRKADVLHKYLKKRQSPLDSPPLFYLGHSSKCAQRRCPRLLRRHAALQVLLDGEVDMGL